MLNTQLYLKSYTVNEWVTLITEKFNDISFITRTKDIGTILDITSKIELNKISEASLIVFGKTLGVTTFEEACDKLGQSKMLPNLSDLGPELATKHLAEYKLSIIIKALNEGWYPNWKNPDEYKYFPYFNMNLDDCGFSYRSTTYSSTCTDVPSALFLKSSELAAYCGLKFISLYKEYYI